MDGAAARAKNLNCVRQRNHLQLREGDVNLDRGRAADDSMILRASGYRDGFAFIGLGNVLIASPFFARPIGNPASGSGCVWLDLQLPGGLTVRLSHEQLGGTSLRALHPTDAGAFEELVERLEVTPMPTKWTPMHPSILEWGRLLAEAKGPSFWSDLWRLLKSASSAGSYDAPSVKPMSKE